MLRRRPADENEFVLKQKSCQLSQFFVPVWMSNDDYEQAKLGRGAELTRIKRVTASKKFVNGDVNVFLDPEGDVVDTLVVAKAMEPQNLLPLLKRKAVRKKA